MIVYALLDPDTKHARYIGKTIARGEIRLASHISMARRQKRPLVTGWIGHLLEQGKRPILMEIEQHESHDDLLKSESYWISQFRGFGAKLLNVLPGGGGSAIGWHQSEEVKAKLRSIFGERHPNFGRVTPQEVRDRLAIKTREWLKNNPPNQLGRKATPEVRQKLRDARLGASMNLTEEQSRRKSERRRELWKDPAYREKMAGRYDLKNANTQVVLVDGEQRCIKDIARQVGLGETVVRRRFHKYLANKPQLTLSDFERKRPARPKGSKCLPP